MDSSCERCKGEIDGPAYRKSRVNRCLSCSRVCRKCDQATAEHPFWLCKPCWPSCEKCGGDLPSKGRKTTRKRCDDCVDLCRRCDVPIPRGDDPDRRKKVCDGCSGVCTKCGGPGPGRSGACSPCRTSVNRSVETAARNVLGNRCVRCSIGHPLHWDHINDDPRKSDTVVKRASVMQTEMPELRAVANGLGSSRLQLLCPNCNYLKQYDRAEYDKPPTYGPICESGF